MPLLLLVCSTVRFHATFAPHRVQLDDIYRRFSSSRARFEPTGSTATPLCGRVHGLCHRTSGGLFCANNSYSTNLRQMDVLLENVGWAVRMAIARARFSARTVGLDGSISRSCAAAWLSHSTELFNRRHLALGSVSLVRWICECNRRCLSLLRAIGSMAGE